MPGDGFVNNTRLKLIKGSVMSRPTGGGQTQIELPKTGILAGIIIPVSVAISGTLSAPNANGIASVIKRIQLKINAGQTIFDISGAGYFYLLDEMMQDNYLLPSYSDARSAVTTGTKNLDIFLPVALNTRDEIGLIMLQNMQTFATLMIDWEADATVATGATITGTASPLFITFEVPSSPKDYPNLSTIHQVQEEQIAISAAGDFDHHIPIGATLVGQYYLFATAWTNAQLRLQNSNVVADITPEQHRILFQLTTSRDPLLSGAITGSNKRLFWDFSGTDGLGQFGSVRDWVNTGALTDIMTRLTASAAGTLYAVRRQILNIVPNGQ